MVSNKQFAPQYPRIQVDVDGNMQEAVKFPNDVSYRKSMYPDSFNISEHPAKANMYMIEEIVEYVSEVGERVMDIMSGTGTIMLAATRGRNVVCLEIEEFYHNLQKEVLANFQQKGMVGENQVLLLHGDCRKFMPLSVDHIIFSPPYASILRAKNINKTGSDFIGGVEAGTLAVYSNSPDNVGRLNSFFYNMEMEKIYQLCYKSVRVGGTTTIIIKDYIEEGQRVWLSNWVIKACIRAGFKLSGWFKRDSPGTGFTKLYRSRGWNTVNDEDIIIVRK